jgi:hypothetical protein
MTNVHMDCQMVLFDYLIRRLGSANILGRNRIRTPDICLIHGLSGRSNSQIW